MSIIANKIKDFWRKHDYKILVIMGFFLLSATSFNAGRTYENSIEPAEIKLSLNQSPLIAANPHQEKILALGEAVERNGQAKEVVDPILGNNSQQLSGSEENKECVFVGSKNSNKYHLPTCRYAANIKEENRVCFSSKEDAEGKGYEAGKCCIK